MNAKSLFATPAGLLTGVKIAARDIAENATEAMICPAVINVYRCLFVRVPVDSVGLGDAYYSKAYMFASYLDPTFYTIFLVTITNAERQYRLSFGNFWVTPSRSM